MVVENTSVKTESRRASAAAMYSTGNHASYEELDMDPYNEDEAELRYLLSKPTCFLVLGKPGSGKSTLAKHLGQKWNCEIISATDVIQRAMDMQTELGLKAQEVLLMGEAVPESVVSKMIEDKINSPEVAHHGYVLDGFPSLSEDYMDIKSQLELIKNWTLQPDFIINLKIPDKDVEARRMGQRVDPMTGEIYTKDLYDPEIPPAKAAEVKEKAEEEAEEEEEEEEEVQEEENGGSLVPKDVTNRLVRRPEDLADHVEQHIQEYKSNMLSALEDYMADHDQQYLIELDANKPIHVIFKELMTRLNCFILHPALVPLRLHDGEEEMPIDIETEELMRSLAPKKMIAPHYRWRRSRWLRYCPVSLAEGNLIQGKPEFAVSFLDKIYIMASMEAMAKFMKNPRLYLLPPLPRPPCKLCITGPPSSGKTTLAHKLAQKYDAVVLDMDELIKPAIEEERKKRIEAARESALPDAMYTVKRKLQEQLIEQGRTTHDTTSSESEDTGRETVPKVPAESESRTKEGEMFDEAVEINEEAEKETTETRTETDETKTELTRTDERTESVLTPTVTEGTKPDTTDGAGGAQAEEMSSVASHSEPPMVEVTEDHPEVKAILDAAAEQAALESVELPAELWIDVMEKSIYEQEKENRRLNPNGPINGGWILDNFPKTRDQWNVLIERGGLLPDDVISLNDESPEGEFLLKRWYQTHKEEVDSKAQARRQAAEAERHRREQEELVEQERQRREKEEAAQLSVVPAGEGETTSQEETQQDEVPGKQHKTAEQAGKTTPPEDAEKYTEAESLETKHSRAPAQSSEPELIARKDSMPPEGPEKDEIQKARKLFDNEWPNAAAILTGSTPIQPVSLDINDKSEDGAYVPKSLDAIVDEAIASLERNLQYEAWEVTATDLDEEAEDKETEQEMLAAEAGADDEEAAEEQEVDANLNAKKHLGDVNHFCPVALQERNVLWPGDPEKAVKFREKVYYLSTAEAKEKFLANPKKYLPKDKPLEAPPVRLLLLGPRGSGKTLHGRDLASKLGVFHIQFHERLQEMIMAKTKRRVGPEYNEEYEEDQKVELDDLGGLEAEVAAAVAAITDPQGKPVQSNSDGKQSSSKNSDKGKQSSSKNSDKGKQSSSKNEEQEDKEEEKEEEEVKLTEDEEAIKGYLENNEALPTELLDKIVQDWWNTEPFKSTGFVLEGFPRTADEAEYIASKGLYPDAAIILVVEDIDIIGRLLPPRMALWQARRAKVLAKKARRRQLKKQKLEAEKAKRRAEIMKEQEERRAERQAAREQEGDKSDAEEEEDEEAEEEEQDIEALLEEEFEVEEEEEEEDLEMEEDAFDRIKNKLEEVYDNDINKLAAVQEKLEDALIPRIELEGRRKPHIVRYLMTKQLRKIVQFRHSVFERVYPISEMLALYMLHCGYKQPSRFGRWCPVKLKDGDCMQPMQGPGYPTYPAIYRQHIYFLSSAVAREQFQMEPMNFLRQPTPKPVVPIRMAIIGPPKAGKTTLAKRFAEELGMVRLSVGEAVRQIMELQPRSELAQSIRKQLIKGQTVPEELAVQALAVALMDVTCQTRGYVLDGYPTTRKQAELLRDQNIIPVQVVDLHLDSKEVVTRATKDRYASDRAEPSHDSHQILAIKLACFKKEAGQLRDFYREEHANLIPLDGQRSKWWVWNECVRLGKASVVQIQTYLQRISDGKAASIADMCITPTQFIQRLGDFGQYCPVNLATKQELVDCSTKSLKYAAEFRGHYYKMEGGKELEMFLSEPEKYVPPLAPHKLPPPEMLPRVRTAQEAKNMFPKTVELLGYCPVTYLDGKCRYEAIVPGDPDLVVEYREKLYYLESPEKLDKFMRSPEKYWQLKLPHKLPPKKEPVQMTGLPMLGFMEQTVAANITKALTAVGSLKPKYPFLSPSQSALIYVAYHLKAYNPKSSDYIKKKYRKKLTQFEEACTLINYLGDRMSRKYKEPVERPTDFNFKLERFINLKSTKPMMSWIA